MPLNRHRLFALFKDMRMRVLLIVILAMLVIVVGLSLWGLRKAHEPTPSGASLKKIPAIESIPGVQQASREYIKAQQEENLRKAKEAAAKGTAAVPTVTSAGYLGPATLGQPSVTGCNPDELSRARLAGVKAEELRCKGCSAAALRAAGYTAGELMNAGFSAKDLRDAGFSAAELRAAGMSAAELAKAGFSPQELAAAGYSAAELAAAGLSPSQLAAAGLTAAQLRAAGIGPKEKLPKDCSIKALTDAHKQGVPAGQIRHMGCSADAMKAAGYTAAELKAAGFSAGELKAAGFSCKELKDAGFTAGELRQGGCTAAELAQAGFDAAELRNAGFSAEELKAAGFTPDQLKAAGFSDGELLRAGFTRATIEPKVPPKVVTVAVPTAGAPAVAAPVSTGLVEPVTPPAPAETPPPSQGLSAVVPISDEAAAQVAALERLQKRQQEQLSQQQRADALAALAAAMTTQANELFAAWTPPPDQRVVIAKDEQTGPGACPGKAGTAGAGAASGQGAGETGPVIKAGTVMYGVLDTAINSDEQSPILATIVQGELKGTRMVGSFDRVDKKVVLSFKTMNIPSLEKSVHVDAVAIDPNTARTALASNVDNHYLLRYGTLFASSFVSGLGQAISQSGSQVQTGSGGTIVTYNSLNAGEKALVALGQVGTQYAAVLGKNFTRPPTITVDAGSGIGVLFMSDVAIPLS